MYNFSHIFMIGIGGIGMSALARYFARTGKIVAGYDRTPSTLTGQLQDEGIRVSFKNEAAFPESSFSQNDTCLVVFTPAVKSDNAFMKYFNEGAFTMLKRADVLGEISKAYKTIAVAGTHGKTSVSCMIAHLLSVSESGCNAILGGLPKNYGTNFLWNPQSKTLVTEADEFDKSFLKLHPHCAVITSADADHLDIYENHEALTEAFKQFAGKVHQDGMLLVKKKASIDTDDQVPARVFTYSLDDEGTDVHARNIRIDGWNMTFDLVTPEQLIRDLNMEALGEVNIENAVAASFMAHSLGISEQEIKEGLKSFRGVSRRFDRQLISGQTVFVDDYAHHPEEIRALINSVRSVYPGRKITGIFQPHLYTRTRDFAIGFAESLSMLDEVILLDIYPAREKPIPGITSEIILKKINHNNKSLVKKENLINTLKNKAPEILLSIGAGDIDRMVKPIREMLEDKTKTEDKS